MDEPDLVKARGSRVFAAAGSSLHAVETGGAPRLIDTVPLDGFDHELMLSGERLLVISDDYSKEQPPQASSTPGYFRGRPVTILTEVDVSNPAAMRVLRVERIGGAYLTARLTGSTARVIVSSVARGLDQPAFRSRLRGWVPRSTLASKRTNRTRTRRLSKCGSVRRSTTYSGLDMLTVLTIDMEKGLPAVDSDALMSGAEIVYASTRRLYVATQQWMAEPEGPQDRPPDTRTAIHAFDTSRPGRTAYVGSGGVPGHLLNQFALSEREGVLRAASTDTPPWWGGAPQRESESFVSTLRPRRDGRLVKLGRVGGLGRGERIYAVRFIDDVGYVVTFRQTDPLYTVDLSRPATPRVLGELKIAGYSAYLHPLAGDLLLGVGQDATDEGRTLGTQVSLFDVADPKQPRRLHRYSFDSNSSSSVEYDHRAFLWWAPAKLAVVPVQKYSYPDKPFVGAVGLRVDRAQGIAEAGRASHEQGDYSAYITRAFVVRGRLFTLSAAGLELNNLRTLAEEGRVDFPAARPGP